MCPFSWDFCYEQGKGVEADKGKAVEYYLLGAEAGDARAQCNLGFCCYQGIALLMSLPVKGGGSGLVLFHAVAVFIALA